MTRVPITRRKTASLIQRSSARHVPARVVALHPWPSARAKLPFYAFSPRPDVSTAPKQ